VFLVFECLLHGLEQPLDFVRFARLGDPFAVLSSFLSPILQIIQMVNCPSSDKTHSKLFF
jgi:hypothetical protein